jgi:hypothetical protein
MLREDRYSGGVHAVKRCRVGIMRAVQRCRESGMPEDETRRDDKTWGEAGSGENNPDTDTRARLVVVVRRRASRLDC